MPVEVTVPPLGESILEATVGQWRKQQGDAVQAGEVLVELETDKVNIEVSASEAGVLRAVVKPEGATVAIGDVLATVDPAARQAPTAAAAQAGAAPSADAAPVHRPDAAGGPSPRATPLAQRIAAEHGIDLSTVPGTGPGGQIRQEDVEALLTRRPSNGHGVEERATQQRPSAQPAAPAATAVSPQPTPAPAPALTPAATDSREERVRLSRRRLTIAQRLVETQQTAAMLTTFNEVDMTAIMELRKRRRDAFKDRHQVNLGFMSFFTRAAIGALKAYPRLNAEIQGQDLVLKHHYDIGIAVSTAEGLVVPVLRAADRMTFAEIERAVATLAQRAREGALTLDDLRGGTFTITNGGVFGSLFSTPILNGPQAGILGMHAVQERPVVRDGAVVVRPMMYVALSYDHRIVDGAEAVSFLVRVKELAEDPEQLLLEA